jgi:hypothetical protein
MVQPKYSPEEALQRVKLMMNYDLSKTSVENNKVIEEQTQKSSDSLSCIKKYYTSKNIKFEEYTYSSGAQEISVNFAEKIQWAFEYEDGEFINKLDQYVWKEKKDGKIEDYDKGWGTWECDGKSNFIIKKDDGTIYKSSQPNRKQTTQPAKSTTQPVSQQTQPTKPQKSTDVRRGKERLLKQPLKDDSVSVLNCRKQIDDLYDAWVQRNSSTPETKAAVPKIRDIVQACYDQHKGKFLLGKDADNKLTILSGRNTKVGGPLENGSTAIYRIKGN